MIEHRAETVAFAGNLLRLLHLTDNLRFAEHHRVKTRGHTERVLGGLFVFIHVHMRLKLGERNVLAFGNERKDGCACLFDILCGAVDFRAVAGRKNGGFADAAGRRAGTAVAKVSDGLGNFVGTEGHAFTDGNRRSGMVET